MATKQNIIEKIDSHIRRKSFLKIFWGYKFWHIGITENPLFVTQSIKHPRKLKTYKISKAKRAKAIEKYFLKKGMKGESNRGNNPTNVYVY